MTMQTVVNVSCDGENCTHVRASDANHWLVGLIVEKEKLVVIATHRVNLPSWNTQSVPFVPENVKDFCGEECAIKWVSKMLAEIKK